jgi:hypothetical protein
MDDGGGRLRVEGEAGRTGVQDSTSLHWNLGVLEREQPQATAENPVTGSDPSPHSQVLGLVHEEAGHAEPWKCGLATSRAPRKQKQQK